MYVTHDVDFLVIGSGVAGLTYAIQTAKAGRTLLLTKKNRAESNSNYAQGGIAGVLSDEDDVALHAKDTLVAGAGLCHEDAVNVLVTEGPDRIRDLIALGAQFSMQTDVSGRTVLQLGLEGGHSRNRIVHAADRTGWECERTLLAATRNTANLQIREHYFVVDLALSSDSGDRRCVGAYALDPADGNLHLFRSRATLLATGGCGCIYRHTTNPAIATGDGVAMAWRAGADIANMEFIQFHPTSLYHPEGGSFLISEAVRGEGGILRRSDGSTFMENYHPLGALAPRDIVARAIHAERLKRGEPCVYLDVTHLDADFLRERFPAIYERCLALGIDITRQPIPVVPAAHYQCGGVVTDLQGRTTLPGLLAAGEVACTGVHGANRLASNSLLEAMVFGYRASQSALHAVEPRGAALLPLPSEFSTSPDLQRIEEQKAALRSTMNELVGIVRTTRELNEAQSWIDAMKCEVAATLSRTPESYELRNMLQVAGLIVACALLRKESRGLHYTTDFPETDDLHWKHDTVVQKAS